MKKLLTVVFVLLVLAGTSCAEDLYYAQSAAGSNDASSCANAKAVSAMSWGAGAGNIGAGDTAHLCGTITSSIVVGASGTDLAANAVTVKFEPGAALSKPVWGDRSATSAIYISSKSYVIIDGAGVGIIENTENGTGLTYQDNSSLIYIPGSSYITIKNLTLRNVYVRTTGADSPPSYISAIINMLGNNNITIDNNIISHGRKLVLFGYTNSSNYEVKNNSFDNFQVGLTFGSSGAGSSIDNVLVHNNTFHKSTAWDGGVSHTDGSHFYASHANTNITGVKLYNNTYSGVCNTGNTASAYFESSPTYGDAVVTNPLIYNNVFTFDNGVSGCGDGALYLKKITNAYVYGNTFATGGGGTDTDSVIGILAGGGGTGHKIKNNIFVGFNNSLQVSGVLESDHNIFYPTTTVFNYNGSTQLTFAQWKATSGFDGNSSQADPLFTSVTDWHLQAGSPAIGNGTVLGAPYDTDKDAVARGSIWDIGAYEFIVATTVSPSIRLHIFRQ